MLHRSLDRVGPYESLDRPRAIDKCIVIDQKPIGRTPRSNPATYTKAFDLIRELFAQMPRRRPTATAPGRFSFNVRQEGGGRCEACEGDGVREVEMHFLAERLRHVRGVQGQALQRRDAARDLQGQEHRRDARHAGRRGARAVPAPQAARRGSCKRWSTSASATCRSASRRPRCRAARPSASSSPASSPACRPAARCTCSTSRRPASTSTTSRSCSRCSAASSTPATPCS